MSFYEIKPDAFKENAFNLIGKDWMLITASDGKKTNAMTASWGGLGEIWGKPSSYVVIRPQRYTKEFVDKSENYSLCFFEENMKDMLTYFGSVSGRDENKITKSGLTLAFDSGTPYFEQSRLVLICQKRFVQPINPDSILLPEIHTKWYPEKDYHTMYIGEVIKILKRD